MKFLFPRKVTDFVYTHARGGHASHQIMACFGALLVHPIIGKIAGILMFVPLLASVAMLLMGTFAFSIASIIYLLISFSVGSFLLFFIHELGHVIAYATLGIQGFIEVSFHALEMRAIPKENNLSLSTSDAILRRGVSGAFANVLAFFFFSLIDLVFGLNAFRFIASLQLVGSLSATSWITKVRNTDAARIAEAISLKDKIKLLDLQEIQEPRKEFRFLVELPKIGASVKNYWIELKKIRNVSLSEKKEMPLVFEAEDSTILIFPSSLGQMELSGVADFYEGASIISKCGSRVSLTRDPSGHDTDWSEN